MKPEAVDAIYCKQQNALKSLAISTLKMEIDNVSEFVARLVIKLEGLPAMITCKYCLHDSWIVNLHELKCEACSGRDPPLEDREISELHPNVPDWELALVDGIRVLRRVYKFKDFAEALSFTNKVGALAEAQGHHPALLTEWGQVTVMWWTHKIAGLHKNDFVMAAKTDQLK